MSETVPKTIAICSFCGAQKTPDTPLIAGNEGMICESCVHLAHQVVANWSHKKKSASMITSLKTPVEIKQHLDQYVIGQDTAKETLAVAVYNHYLRLLNQGSTNECLQETDSTELEKSNVIMAGPSGTGKTLLVKSLAKVIGVPIVIADATTLTQAGYVGDDVDTVLQRLLEAAEGDVLSAEWGIVYIDEIDKLARTGTHLASVRDVSGEGVQQALLKMVEGAQVKLSKGDKRRGGEEAVLDTTNILFVVGGAFPGLEGIVDKRLSPQNSELGFLASSNEEAAPLSHDSVYSRFLPEDFQQFGIIPEFIGRFPVITFLEELDEAALMSILQEPKNALVKQYRQLFHYQGIDLTFTDAALRRIAKLAMDRGTGARGLRGIMESVLRKTMFELPSTQGIAQCIVDEQTVNDAAELIVSQILGVEGVDANPADAEKDSDAPEEGGDDGLYTAGHGH